ncbi:MAG: lipid-A-disaccharide synthase [Gammaproteobacteria bacterium]|jgi:lipid-A-disaccharide synthase
MLRIGIVAGEASGDLLAADLIRSLSIKLPNIIFEGIGGPLMEAAGCKLHYSYERLAVLGLFEVVGRYMELLGIRNNLKKYFITNPPDIFIGIDAPDFNLGLERALRKHGIKTVHYVSPSVWAWRRYRVKKIKKSTDLMLVLFPFETDIYKENEIPVKYVGHPLAHQIDNAADKTKFRKRLGLPLDAKIIALMPGSRKSEIEKLFTLQIEAACICNKKLNNLFFITSMLSNEAAANIEKKYNDLFDKNPGIRFKVFVNQSREVLSAADVGLLTSGTVTLEAMLYGLPMVVVYRINWLSAIIIRLMVNVQFAALPNLLAGKKIVQEFLQNDCKPEKMAEEILRLLESPDTKMLTNEFNTINRSLKLDSSNLAADAILSLSGKI